jgi:DNA-binding winged helix-turn-helix (wHTH) protein
MDNRVRLFYEFGDFRIDIIQRELQRNGRAVPLTLKAFDLLLVLVENRGHIVEKDRLLEAVWPDSFIEESNLTRNISTLRHALGDNREEPRYIETISKRGYRFIAAVKEIFDEVRSAVRRDTGEQAPVIADVRKLAVPRENNESVGGAVPLDSEFYIVRPADTEFHDAIARQDSIVLIKGSRQMGKTSLLARGLQRAREAGATVVLTDFQFLSTADFNSAETLYLTLSSLIEEQLDLEVSPRSVWRADSSANVNFERYIRREVLKRVGGPLVWGLDEVDRLFSCSFGSEVFGLFRSWHNMRSLDPAGPWRQLTLAIVYATEAHLFITDVNQSPFNVGTQVQLDDFTIEQVEELNRRYGSPLKERAEVERFYGLVGGHPFLVRRGLYEMARGMALTEFESQSDRDEGPFGNHLRRIMVTLSKDGALMDVMRGVLEGRPCPTPESFYRLRSAGLITGNSARDPHPRCLLYSAYLKQHM